LNISVINVDYMSALDKTNRTEIIDAIHNNLSNLTTAQILDGLEIKAVKDGINKDEKDNKIEENDKRAGVSDTRTGVSDKRSEENDKIPEEKSDRKETIGEDNHDTPRQEQNDT